MKKQILLSVMLLQVVFLFAQGSLQMFTAGGEQINNGQHIIVEVTDLDAFETVSEEYFVRNNSSEDLNIKMRMQAIELVDGADYSFCALGACFPPGMYETPGAYSLPAETTVGSEGVFTGHYHAKGFEGTSIIQYTFFNVDDLSDTIAFYIAFDGDQKADPSLQMLTQGSELIENGQTITVEVTDLDAFEAVSEEYFVRNNSTEDLTIKMRMEAVDLVEGADYSFCALGSCFPPGIFETGEYDIAAETTVGSGGVFTGHYHPKGFAGTSIIRYTFFNVDDLNDTISFMILFNGNQETESSLQLLTEDEELIENGQTIIVDVTDLEAFETVSDEYFVRNNSTEDLSVKMRIEAVELVEGADYSFCALGSCYPPGISVTPREYEIAAETTVGANGVFTGHYHPKTFAGNSLIRYTYFNVDDLNDTISFKISFVDITAVNNIDEDAVISAYPNPASDVLYIDYNLKAIDNGQLNVYNILGKKMISKEISSSNGRIELNVSDLSEGIYLYNFQSGNMKSKTYKVLVK